MRGVAAWVLLALTAAPVAAGEQGKAPQWAEIRPLCGRLQKEGWKPADPLGQEDEGRAEVRVGGRVGIFLCRVKRALPMQGRGTPTELEVFMQHRGGDNVSVSARIWRDADRQAALEGAAELFTRLVRDLGMTAPAGFAAAIRQGQEPDEEEDGLRFSVSKRTREMERNSQPDLKPEDVPLLTVDVSIEPVD
jgi:hypothetical protein